MFGIFKHKQVNPDQKMYEFWKTNFGWLKQKRFSQEETEDYASYIKGKAFYLEIKKKNCFAWVISKWFKYSDFVIESQISFAPENAYSAFGFILRYINDENFYYFLLSNKGNFRFDVIFNGNPIHLVEWTECPIIQPHTNQVRIITHGSHFSFYIDDEWVAEIGDETIAMGRIGLCAQNFNQEARALFKVSNFSLESRSISVEKAYYRWARYIPAQPELRVNLAHTLFTMDNFQGAAVQLKKALKGKKGTADELFLYAESLLNLRLYDNALEQIENVLTIPPLKKEARLEKANLLYLLNRFLDARDYINTIISDFKENAVLLNLLGNTEYTLGNWEKALKAYLKAVKKESEMPIYLINAARCEDRLKHNSKALVLYLKAAHLLFRNEAYNDLSLILPRILELDPQNNQVIGFHAKMLFHEDKKAEAKPLLEKLASSGIQDSTVYFLLALILIEEGERKNALTLLSKAVELEPKYALYWFRLAENKYLMGMNPKQELRKSHKLAPNDPWINNLYGLYYKDKHRIKMAEKYLTNAYEKAPKEVDIIINLSDLFLKKKNKDKALALLDKGLKQIGKNARLYNHKGNILGQVREFESATVEYEKAIDLEPENTVYLENCAASCLEADRIMSAEELLVKALDIAPSPSLYNLLGNTCLIKGEYKRAQLCYEQGLSLDPQNREIKLNLAAYYLERLDYQQAKELLKQVLKQNPLLKRAQKLRQNLRTRFEIKLLCAMCKREWWVYKEIPLQDALKVYGEPPPESPAGKCQKCGKIYCISCATENMKDKRFLCADCDEFLKLSDNYLRYLVTEYMESVQ